MTLLKKFKFKLDWKSIFARARKIGQDLVMLGGLVLVCFGIAKIYRPAGAIAAGIVLCVLSLAPGKSK